MTNIILGTLAQLDARSVWRHEASDFTPWLAQPDSLKLLGDSLRLGELTLQATEKDVGEFSADIVAVEEGGAHVLIENQLEATDHRHLGQVLTYLAGLEGDATVVWIATRFREEHRAAIDWLNANTNERFDFFGVEIEVLKIGDSAAAPRFNIVAKPNDWSRAVGVASRRLSEGASSEGQAFNQEYWLGLKQSFMAAGEKGHFPKPWQAHWLPFKIGRSGFGLHPCMLRKERRIRFELYMHQKGMPPKLAYRQLEAQRSEIERELGTALDWQELPESTASRIAVYLDKVDLTDHNDWPRQHTWIREQLHKFRRVFSQRVQALELGVVMAGQGQDDAEVG
jgi:hypothetical protein